MKTALAIFLALAALAAFAGAYALENEAPAREIEVTERGAASGVAAISEIMNDLTAKIVDCARTREPPKACQCEHMEELGRLKTAYDAALRDHPEWENAHVYYRETGRGITSVSFPGVAERLDMCR